MGSRDQFDVVCKFAALHNTYLNMSNFLGGIILLAPEDGKMFMIYREIFDDL